MEKFITCKLCGKKVKRIYGKHLKFFHNNISSEEYKKMFPGSPLQTLEDKKNVCKNSGKFMKEEKWRKWASERIKGDLNPMHKSNKSQKERKEASPFSKEYYKKRGMKEEDRNNFIKDALKDREFNNRIDYWIKRGYSKEKARDKIKERQTTFSKKICIEKYGKEEGIKKWEERQRKWKNKVFNKDTYIGNGSSKLSKKIAKDIIEKFNFKDLLFGKNEKFIYDENQKRVFKYDITRKKNKKIIEVMGVFWHCKPSLYESNYIHPVRKINAKSIWEFDFYKNNLAKKNGYDILCIWEDEYLKNPEEIINKCVNFLNG